MKNTIQTTNIRWFYLAVGTFAMLFAGILYAWSILKAPFFRRIWLDVLGAGLQFHGYHVVFFCMGGLLGAQISKRMGSRFAILVSGVLAAGGFILTSLLTGSSVFFLYLTYGVLAGLGIGISYNVVVATVSAWFPDQKGLCSGCLMMGFGASALVLGNWASAMFDGAIGWRKTYVILGLALGVVLILAGWIPEAARSRSAPSPGGSQRVDPDPGLHHEAKCCAAPASGWRFFIWCFCRSSVISFARDLALSVGGNGWAGHLPGGHSVHLQWPGPDGHWRSL